MKFLICLALIFIGEAITIWSELYICRYDLSVHTMVTSMLCILVACACLLYGYRFSYETFKDIWTVSVISVGAIAILEPSLVWLMFHQMPKVKHIIGFVLGLLGIIMVSA